MDGEQLATKLLAVVAPGDAVFERMIAAGEYLPAVVTLVEVAAEDGCVVPTVLLDAVQRLLDDDAFDVDDDRSVAEDLGALRAATPVLR